MKFIFSFPVKDTTAIAQGRITEPDITELRGEAPLEYGFCIGATGEDCRLGLQLEQVP